MNMNFTAQSANNIEASVIYSNRVDLVSVTQSTAEQLSNGYEEPPSTPIFPIAI